MPEARHYDALLCETRKNSQAIICHSELVSESITSQAEGVVCHRALADLRTDGAGASLDSETARTAKSVRTKVRVRAPAMAGTGAWSKSKTDARSKKAAFTLAEVLISLGIIGVVAALTLPTLIQNYQEKQRVSQLKKAYSVFSQAYRGILLRRLVI